MLSAISVQYMLVLLRARMLKLHLHLSRAFGFGKTDQMTKRFPVNMLRSIGRSFSAGELNQRVDDII